MRTVYVPILAAVGLLITFQGCSTMRMTNTSRTGKEQLLISNAVDQVLNDVDFSGLQGRSVYVQEKYLACVDKGYIAGTIRHQVLTAGARLVDQPDQADVVMEVRSGGVGTDNLETYVGFPGIALPGPMPVELPEVKIWTRNSQLGSAKLAIVAYDAKGRHILHQGGKSLARSNDSHWYIMGIGPMQSGTLRDELRLATVRRKLTAVTSPKLPSYGNQTVPGMSFHDPQTTRVAEPPSYYPTTNQAPERYR